MTLLTLPDLWPDLTTADLLVTDAPTLPCGCTRDRDCAHAAHLRERPALARQLVQHRAPLHGAGYALALVLTAHRGGEKA